jgi:hypothetical protein
MEKMEIEQKRELMDVLAEAIQLLVTVDDAQRNRAISSLQYIYQCLERGCRGDTNVRS